MSLLRYEPGPITRIRLSRPEARNAVSSHMLADLLTALGNSSADPAARVVLLSGEGPDFCAGADLAELEESAGGPGGVSYGKMLDEVLAAIVDHPLPIVAGVQGSALGAGCQLVVACDMAVAASDARLGIPSARLGVVIAFESIERLLLAVGPKRAAAMLEAGRVVSGAQAEAWGLVNEAVEPSRLEARVEEIAAGIAGLAPLSVRGSKRGLRAAIDGERVADVEMLAAEAFASDDLREGIRAFRERRPPTFRGR